MPAWWSKKSRKTKDSAAPAVSDERNKGKEIDKKTISFDEVLLQPQSRNSPRSSRDYSSVGKEFGGRNSSGFSGFDSASSLDRGHPLPKPSEQSNDHAQGAGSGSGSDSVSSVSSSGSYDDHTDHALLRGNGESRLSPLPRSPGSRCVTATTSPLHSRQRGINLDSPTAKLEDGRSDCHRLPLPPSSPTSPSALPTPRSPERTESPISHSFMWRKGKLLGKGTFGHVYLGFNSESGQMCAIKEVKVVSDDQSSKESLKQLNQEITLLRQLSHPNIVRYYGSDLSEQSLSVYLEYVSGGSIHKLLQEYGSFAEPVIQNYTRQILTGLSYLHGRNTVHRDIKGANILVDPNGEIKLADFGMAKHIASSCSMLSFKGSPYWMAPEVVMNKNGYSLPVDIWSLGCTVLEMAMSKPPWSQYEGVAAIFKIGNSRDIPEIPDHLSADAKSFIRLCLQREPCFRPTASQLLTHPFIRHQITASPTTIPVPRETFPRAFDGSHTPPILEMHTSKTSRTSLDIEDAARLMVPRTIVSPRDYARNITSLPVSPSSSPLRSDGASRRNFFLSPPHPSYTSVAQSSRQYNDHSILPFRPNSRNLFDPPEFGTQAPGRSPTRQELSSYRTPTKSYAMKHGTRCKEMELARGASFLKLA